MAFKNSKLESKLDEIEKKFLSLTPFKIRAAENTYLPTVNESIGLELGPKKRDCFKKQDQLPKITKPIGNKNKIKNPKSKPIKSVPKSSKKIDTPDRFELANQSTEVKKSESNESIKSDYEFTYWDTGKIWQYMVDFDLSKDVFDGEKCQLEEVKLAKINQFSDSEEDEPIKMTTHNIPYITAEIIENDPFCNFCRDVKLDEISYPCRICNKVFHLSCVESRGLFRNEREKQMFLQAFSNIGWSCFECSNLSRLIPETEIREIIDTFEFSDTNQDYGISKEEFLWMQKEDFYNRLGEEMTPEIVEVTNLRFELTDTDQSGFIDWDEYLNFECSRRLYRMPESELVLKLTPKEIQRARETFHCFDKDKNGVISIEEATRVHRDWFKKVYQMKNLDVDIEVLDLHVKVHNQLLMEASLTGKEEVNWDEYLQHQAANILSGRPNHPRGIVGKYGSGNIADKKTSKFAANIGNKKRTNKQISN